MKHIYDIMDDINRLSILVNIFHLENICNNFSLILEFFRQVIAMSLYSNQNDHLGFDTHNIVKITANISKFN